MKMTSKFVAVLLFSVCSIYSQAQDVALVAEPVVLADSTVGETNALIGAINAFRADLRLPPLSVDAALSERAAAAFPGVVNAPGEVDVTELRRTFGATNVAILRGIVTHRGAKSGGEFPKYWAKDPQWNAVIIGDFSHMGAATVKRSDGKLVAFVYMIKK
jgi:hypothetical protein